MLDGCQRAVLGLSLSRDPTIEGAFVLCYWTGIDIIDYFLREY